MFCLVNPHKKDESPSHTDLKRQLWILAPHGTTALLPCRQIIISVQLATWHRSHDQNTLLLEGYTGVLLGTVQSDAWRVTFHVVGCVDSRIFGACRAGLLLYFAMYAISLGEKNQRLLDDPTQQKSSGRIGNYRIAVVVRVADRSHEYFGTTFVYWLSESHLLGHG